MQDQIRGRQLFDRACALTAILAAAAYGYGMRIWLLAGTAFAVSLLTEWCCLYLRKRPFTRADLDAGLCGVILMLMMPASVPFSLLIMSCIFAIIFGRQLFGGRENPVVHPAAAGFCFAMLNQRAAVTMFPKRFGAIPLAGADAGALVSGISDTFNRGRGLSGHAVDWLTGLPNQPLGTGSVVLLAVVAAVLVLRKAANGWVLLPAVAFSAFCSVLLGFMRQPAVQIIGLCLTNQFLFSVIFLHADPAFSPPDLAGSLYGVALAGASVILTRVLFITDAPVLLAVLLSPAALKLCELMRRYQPQNGGADGAERNEASAVPGSGTD